MKIAVAVDGSKYALRATKYAITLANHLPKAHLKIVATTVYGKVKDEYLYRQPRSLYFLRNDTRKCEP